MNLLVLQHLIVVVGNLTLDASVSQTSIAWNQLLAVHAVHVCHNLVSERHLKVGIVGALHKLKAGGWVAKHLRVHIVHLQLCDTAVHTAKVFRERFNTLGDKVLGVSCHRVLVVDSLLVIHSHQSVKHVDAHLFVVAREREVHHVAKLVGSLGVEVCLKRFSHASHGRYACYNLVVFVLFGVVLCFGDGDRAKLSVHLVAKVSSFPFAVVDLKFQVVATLRHHGHFEWLFHILKRGDLERTGLVAVHIAQKHVSVVANVQTQLIDHGLHQSG